MTRFEHLMAGGESGEVIVPGQPEDSYLVELITPEVDADGQRLAEMPEDSEPLADDQVALVRRWITEGADNDAPPAKPAFTRDNPPLYTQPPVITSVDFSPDGKLLAVAGFHEVLLHKVDSPATENAPPLSRLVGMSDRIQSVAFSPDGKRLAVAAGQPARVGELQVWNVAKEALELSLPVTHDTIYGVSWSPDGERIAFG